jgi:formamidopyrimidine-DNA glycosylase
VPELPEVETVRRGLNAMVRGRALRAATLRRRDLRWPIPVAAVSNLRGRELAAVERRAKYLLLHFSGPRLPVALVHLGMSGRLFVDDTATAGSARRGAAPPEWLPHEHWRMDFGGSLVRFVDARRFGMLDVVPAQRLAAHDLLAGLGPEPLGDAFDGEQMLRATRGRRVAVKTWLMDARNVVGVGNIYASEACFRAGVRPGRSARRTTRAQCRRLAAAVKEVLTDAIRQGGTTLRDFVGADQSAGYFQVSLAVYGRAGEPCVACGAAIQRTVLGGRSTYYCPRCQV